MVLDQVIHNLQRTIEGKQQFLDQLRNTTKSADEVYAKITVAFLEENLRELQSIYTDLVAVRDC
jgi:hypothetical protein